MNSSKSLISLLTLCHHSFIVSHNDIYRLVLADVIPHVRFPLMSVADFSSVVQPSGVVPGMSPLPLHAFIAFISYPLNRDGYSMTINNYQ
jgi:hypothetical protein